MKIEIFKAEMKEEIQQLEAKYIISIEQNQRRNKLPNTHNDEHTESSMYSMAETSSEEVYAQQGAKPKRKPDADDIRQIRATCHVEGEELDEQSAVQSLTEKNHSFPSDVCFDIIKAEQKCLLLELKAPSKILEDIESFRMALRTLVVQIAHAGKIDINKPSTITLRLIFKDDLTEDDIKVIKEISCQGFYSQRIDASLPYAAKSKMLGVFRIPSNIKEDVLNFVFENTRKSGANEDVEEIHTVLVTFEEAEVVERVLRKTPILFQGKVNEDNSYMQDVLEDSQPDIKGAESVGNIFAIHVSGFDPENMSAKTLSLYFDSIDADSDAIGIEKMEENAYIVKFKEEKDIDEILKKTHTVNGRQLTVKRYSPDPPLQKYEEKTRKKGIGGSTSQDSIFNLIEAKTNIEPIATIPGETMDTTPVTFDTKPGMDIPDLSVESIKVSKILAAHAIILPVVKLRQEEAMYKCNILVIFNAHHTDPILMPCGSRAEGLAMLTARDQAHLSSSDEDVIIFANFFKVYEKRSEIQALILSHQMENYILRIPDATYPGYSKLVVSPHDNKLIQFCEFQDQLCFLKHSVKEIIITNWLRQYEHTVHGPAVTIDLFSKTIPSSNKSERRSSMKFALKTKDLVLCLRGQSWPIEACEWKTRQRSSNWPSRELFDKIKKSGYLLAGVGHKESKESEMQWRVSFNRAEQLIIESFNETQIQCLILLRFLKGSRLSKLAGKNITSYTMKTVMFWSLEEIQNEYWQPHNLLYCFCFCLSKLKSFVEGKFLPDYFIRKRNHFISSEFTHDEQTHTRQFLISFLENPKENISILLSSYNLNKMQHYSDSSLQFVGQQMFIKSWLYIRISMAEGYHDLMEESFCNLYDGYNIENILLRCNDVFEKLTRINYAQPFIKLLQNCMCVLQYMLLRKEREIPGHITDSDKRRQCLEYMELGLAADLTHTSLRVATCLLDDGVGERDHCIALIRSVTDHPNSYLYKKAYSDVLKEKLENPKIQAFETLHLICKKSEIPIYNKIISQDLIYQDPYRTVEQFKLFKEQGYQVGWHSKFLLVYDWCWFNVTFMSAELPVLPKPAALELCIDNSKKKISFQPFLYGLLLEFLWHAKYSSTKKESIKVLEKMKSSSELIPHQQSTRLNFITYCCSLQKDYRQASRYLIQSFKLNPVKQNVAYLYIKYIINILRELTSKACYQGSNT